MAFSNISYRAGLEHHLSELRILLVGSVQSGKSSAGNTILGRDTFSLKRTAQCLKRQGEVAGRKITVVEAPGWWSDGLVEKSTKLLKQEILLSVLQCPPGPHAVLLAVRLKLNFTDLDRQVLDGHLNLFGSQVWNHTIVLFTFGDSLRDITIEQHIEYEGNALKSLVGKCGNRYHVLTNENSNHMQITDLLEKIEKMVEGNRGHHFETDTKILHKEVEERRRVEEERSLERRRRVSKQREDIRKRMHKSFNECNQCSVFSRIVFLDYTNYHNKESCLYLAGLTHHYPEVNILLLGCKNAGKSAAGNIILRREGFNLNRAVECVKREGNAMDRKITVVKAPGWWRDRPVEESTALLILSVSQCPPGPHAVLVVVNGDRIFRKNDGEILAGYLMLLGDEIWSHTIVLFTFRESLGDTTIERHIENQVEALRWLIEKCGNRYHVLNIQNRDDDSQVKELLQKIEGMMAENGGCHLQMDTQILLINEDRRTEELKRSTKRVKKSVSKHIEGIQSLTRGLQHFSELRIILLGCRNSGKSSTGNTILGNTKSEFNSESEKCVKREGNVSGMKLTVVEAPGWCSDRPVEESSESLKQEIVLSVSMCPPGPKAVLVAVNVDRMFTEKDSEILAGYMKLFGDEIWSRTIVLFTFGDSVGDTIIERQIESEGEALQWLVEKCGNRYHVFNNRKAHDDFQVTELLEKIKVMVAGNRCYRFEKDTKTLREVEERKGVEEEISVEWMKNKGKDHTYMYITRSRRGKGRRGREISGGDDTGTEVTSPKTDAKGAVFVTQHREMLIQRVSSVDEIADCLEVKKMITVEMYNKIRNLKTPQEKMRELYQHLTTDIVKAEFYQILTKKYRYLVDELEAKSVQA